jgi:hypothetical protein
MEIDLMEDINDYDPDIMPNNFYKWSLNNSIS